MNEHYITYRATAKDRGDVLIVGGGVQGLWLLNDLTKVGYDVVLIEKDKIGGTQTLHSHGYIHQGHLYHDIEMVRRLKSSEDRWERFCKKNNIPIRGAESYYGFASPANADMWHKIWKSAQLPATRMEKLHLFMEKGLLRKVFRFDGAWLDTSILTRCLANEKVARLIYKGDVKDIRYDLTNQKFAFVSIEINGKPFTFAPKVVIFTAGAGNEQLLSSSLNIPKLTSPFLGKYRLRKSQMLVIKGSRGIPGFCELALIVPDLSLFLVSRPDGEYVVWLASYDVDDEYDPGDSLDPNPQRVEDTVSNIFAILPTLFSRSNVQSMEWGVYTGLKAEVDTGTEIPPHEWIVESFDTDNIYAVWPTKLTLVPEASERIVFKLLDIYEPSHAHEFKPDDYGLPQETWEIGVEKWTTTPLSNWEEFRATYKILLHPEVD